MTTIKQDHKHLIAMRWKDGRWVKMCLHHECDYEEPVKEWESYEADM
mgnify:CR=1 FL=1